MSPIERLLNSTVNSWFKYWPRPTPSVKRLESAKIIAHRGAHLETPHIENTLAAFEAAFQAQAWGIEFDIQFSKDHEALIHHDAHLGRLFGRPDLKISEERARHIQDQFPEILSLSELTEKLGGKIHFMIEIKTDLRKSPEAVNALNQALGKLQAGKDFHFMGLNPPYLEPLHHFGKKHLIDIMWVNPKKTFKYCFELDHGGVAGHYLLLNRRNLERLRSVNKFFGVGFPESENSLYRELNRGIDFIFTDHPIRLQGFIKEGLDRSKLRD